MLSLVWQLTSYLTLCAIACKKCYQNWYPSITYYMVLLLNGQELPIECPNWLQMNWLDRHLEHLHVPCRMFIERNKIITPLNDYDCDEEAPSYKMGQVIYAEWRFWDGRKSADCSSIFNRFDPEVPLGVVAASFINYLVEKHAKELVFWDEDDENDYAMDHEGLWVTFDDMETTRWL